jgi:hypothetical protein
MIRSLSAKQKRRERKMSSEDRCVICDEAITNPICPDCLSRQVTYWAHENNSSIMPVLVRVGDSVKEFTHDNTSCVICKKDMNVCPHCYCSEIYSWLIESRHRRMSKKFLKHFNYELDYRFDLKTAKSQES